MKKSGFLRGMLDGLRSTVSQPTAAGAKEFLEANVEEALKPSHFQVETIVRHGFPYQPTSIAFDPIQRLIAIGTKNGSLRLLGRPGVDISVRHVTEFAVIQILFIINEGQLITICADDSLHLWNLKSKKLEIVHTLKFQKERITFAYLSFQSKWLYIGTERGNTYVVNIDNFSLSGYVINWNKAIELSRKTHPGCIIHLSDCPIDSNKLLIGYESGSIVLWDLRNKCADFRHAYSEGIQSISWHSEGRQFICSHNDGSLSTWNVKAGSKPQSAIYPHSKSIATDHKPEPCNQIPKVEWRTVRNGEAYIMFSGGMPVEPNPQINSNQILTVIHGKSTTVLEMEHDIVDFITLCESPYEADYNEPYAIVVLLSKDLVVVDLQTPAYPCFQNPYPMDLHESPVTYCYYMANCPPDLVRAFFLVGHKQTKRSGFSEREWPINGGEWGSSTVSYPEIIITGHADGSMKFWDASSVNLQILYKLKTSKLFERPKPPPPHYIMPVNSNPTSSANGGNGGSNGENEDLFAIEYVCFTAENRTLCVAGASSQVMVFKFNKHECSSEISVVEVTMNYDDADKQTETEIQSGTSSYYQAQEAHDPTSYYPLRVRTGHHKRLPGFQAEMICISPWIDRKNPPYRILSMSHNMHASLLAYGTENSIIIIDLVQRSIVLNVSTASLYGPTDPYQRSGNNERGSRTSKRCTSAGPYSKDLENNGSSDADRCRSPVTENTPSVHSTEHELAPISENDPDADDAISMHSIQSIIDSLENDLRTSEELENASKPAELSPNNTETDSSSANVSGPPSLSTVDLPESSQVKPPLTSSVSLPVSAQCPLPPPRTKRNKKKFMSFTTSATEKVKTESTEKAEKQRYNTEQTVSRIKCSSSRRLLDFCETDDAIEAPDWASVTEALSQLSIDSNLNVNNSNSTSVDEVLEALELDYGPEKDTKLEPSEASSEAAKSDTQVAGESTATSIATNPECSIPHSSSMPLHAPLSPTTSHNYSNRFGTMKRKFLDLRGDEPQEGMMGKLMNKLDSFTRSRSSSMSSLESVGNESIQFIAFANTYMAKNEATPTPTLWIGTSQGSVVVISLTMPDNMDNRVLCLQTVLATPTPCIFRMKGAILNIGFMDSLGNLLSLKPDHWKDNQSRAEGGTPDSSKRTGSLTITRTGSGGSAAIKSTKISPTSSSSDFRDSHLVVLTSEKQIRLIAMPLQLCAQKATITETSFAVRADIVQMKSQADSLCLACYLGTGNIVVYSLPSLRQLIDADFLPLTDVRIARTIFFSTNGHGMYLSSPSELTKFTISSAFCENLPDMVGALYTAPKELPEPPRQSFLKGFFGGAPTPLDREELFGESSSGKALKTTARLIPGSVEHAKAHTAALGGEFAKLREGFTERGERLGKLEDSTAKMQSEAEVFGSVAHAVMLKYRDKKWYQF